MKALLVDPSLFTAPYDAELTDGLVDAGVDVVWVTRPLRPEERQIIPDDMTRPFFYRRSDRMAEVPAASRAALKGFSHVLGLARLFGVVWREAPDVVHFQWTVIPILDAFVILILRIAKPVVVTVHDTTPYNGENISFLQKFGFCLPIKFASHVIVHTASAKQALHRQVPLKRLSIVPHGPLRLHTVPGRNSTGSRSDMRWTFVLFGQIKPYKGVDLLIEAVDLIPPDVRRHARFIVAGAPMMNMGPTQSHLDRLGLRDVVEMRLGRLNEEEVAALLTEADTFMFPYRQIDASGVYFLVKQLSKWIIATRVGIFAEELVDGTSGSLVAPGDAHELANAVQFAIKNRPVTTVAQDDRHWQRIGLLTRAVYELTMSSRSQRELAS